MQSTVDLRNRLRQFVQNEANAQYEALHRQWARPIGARVANGWAIEGLDKGIRL